MTDTDDEGRTNADGATDDGVYGGIVDVTGDVDTSVGAASLRRRKNGMVGVCAQVPKYDLATRVKL